jgi:type VI protein secretion system component VasK
MLGMSGEENKKWLPVLAIAGALAAWGVLLAMGAYLAPGDPDSGRDFRKLWVVAGMTGGFLLLWGGVLWVRARKVRRQRAEQTEELESGQIPRRTLRGTQGRPSE